MHLYTEFATNVGSHRNTSEQHIFILPGGSYQQVFVDFLAIIKNGMKRFFFSKKFLCSCFTKNTEYFSIYR